MDDLIELADLGVKIADEVAEDACLYAQAARVVILVIEATVPGLTV